MIGPVREVLCIGPILTRERRPRRAIMRRDVTEPEEVRLALAEILAAQKAVAEAVKRLEERMAGIEETVERFAQMSESRLAKLDSAADDEQMGHLYVEPGLGEVEL